MRPFSVPKPPTINGSCSSTTRSVVTSTECNFSMLSMHPFIHTLPLSLPSALNPQPFPPSFSPSLTLSLNPSHLPSPLSLAPPSPSPFSLPLSSPPTPFPQALFGAQGAATASTTLSPLYDANTLTTFSTDLSPNPYFRLLDYYGQENNSDSFSTLTATVVKVRTLSWWWLLLLWLSLSLPLFHTYEQIHPVNTPIQYTLSIHPVNQLIKSPRPFFPTQSNCYDSKSTSKLKSKSRIGTVR